MEEKKIIEDLGELDGPLLFFGGVYSNLQALENLQKWANENKFSPQHIFCTGDIAGYCAQPLECIELIREWGIHSIAGNVELQVREDKGDCGCDFLDGGRCDLFSKNWYAFVRSKMSAPAKDFFLSLPHHIRFTFGHKKIVLVHGSWFNTSEFIFRSTSWEKKQANFKAADAEVIIAGHCGLPFAEEKNELTWLNPGVIGMPANDGTDRVWFATMQNEIEGLSYSFRHFQYDNSVTSSLMLDNGLPQSYASTLSTGLWDNCEILPEAETRMQGQQITLRVECQSQLLFSVGS